MYEEPTFRSPEVCRLADVTYRMLDWWCRIGLVHPHVRARGSGSRRGFDLREVQIVWTLGVLSRAGFGLRDLHCVRTLPEWGGWLRVHGRGRHAEHIADPLELSFWPAVTLIALDACPVGVEAGVAA